MDKLHTEAIREIRTYVTVHKITNFSDEIKEDMFETIFNTFIKFTSRSMVNEYKEDYPIILDYVKKHNLFINTNYTEPASVCDAYWYLIGSKLLSDDKLWSFLKLQ